MNLASSWIDTTFRWLVLCVRSERPGQHVAQTFALASGIARYCRSPAAITPGPGPGERADRRSWPYDDGDSKIVCIDGVAAAELLATWLEDGGPDSRVAGSLREWLHLQGLVKLRFSREAKRILSPLLLCADADERVGRQIRSTRRRVA